MGHKANAITQVILSIGLAGTSSVCERATMPVRIYRLVVEGEVSERTWYHLDGMSLRYAGGNTVLLSLVRDPADLQGLLQRVSNLGMTLVSVDMIDDVAQT